MRRNDLDRRRIQNITAYNTAHELALIKEKIKNLKSKEKELKEKLTNVLKIGDYIELENHQELNSDYIVEFIKIRPRPGLSRLKTFRYIEKRFGTEAASGVEENCSISKKPVKSVYVRPFAKKLAASTSELDDSSDLFNDDDLPF